MKIIDLKARNAGTECVILTTGPSLADLSPGQLYRLCKGRTVIAVKQAIKKYPWADYHIINRDHYEPYVYEKRPVVLATVLNKDHMEEADINLGIIRQTVRREACTAASRDWKRMLFDSQEERPWGPGVMHEVAIPLALWLGCTKIIAVGWDAGSAGQTQFEHGADIDAKVNNVWPWEIGTLVGSSGSLYDFIRSRGVEVELCSTKSHLSERIPRIAPPPTLKAIIPCRAGSERVLNKNLAPFAGSTLLAEKIKQLKRIKELDGIIVNSDSPEMLQLARDMGVEATERETGLGLSSANMSEVNRSMARQADSDLLLYCNCTSPLIEDETIVRCIEAYSGTSANVSASVREFMWQDGRPVNYDPQDMPRSQDLPDIQKIAFSCSVISREDAIRYGAATTPDPVLVPCSEIEASDVDTPYDFACAEFNYIRRKKVCMIIPLFGNGDRKENLRVVLDSFEKHCDGIDLLIAMKAGCVCDHPSVVTLETEAEFPRSQLLNYGAKLSGADYYLFHDADIPLPAFFGDEVRAYMAKGLPATRMLRFLGLCSQGYTEKVHAGHDPYAVDKRKHKFTLELGGINPGGSALIRSDVHWGLGGWNEVFTTWGAEEWEYGTRLNEAHPGWCWSGPALCLLHLWHPIVPRDPRKIRELRQIWCARDVVPAHFKELLATAATQEAHRPARRKRRTLIRREG